MTWLEGFSAPLEAQPDGDWHRVTNSEVLAWDILMVLQDRKGEWMFNYDHGLSMVYDVFSQRDDVLALQLETVLRRELGEQEDRVEILGIDVNTDPDTEKYRALPQYNTEHLVEITIRFRVISTGEIAEAVTIIERG